MNLGVCIDIEKEGRSYYKVLADTDRARTRFQQILPEGMIGKPLWGSEFNERGGEIKVTARHL